MIADSEKNKSALYPGSELDMDWIHPWIGLDWIGLGQDFEETSWIGLDWVR